MRPVKDDRVRVKICGLKDAEAVAAAVTSGAAYLGFNFFEPSPRYVSPELARRLSQDVPPGVAKVGLVVDASDAALDALLDVVPLDMVQLHGHESPQRVAELRARLGLPIIKVVGVGGPEDLPELEAQSRVADQLLVDTKPPKGAKLPGGNGVTFDWALLAGRRWPVPWMLAGGLTPQNVADAIARTGVRQVDVSSGVESAPGVKDGARIRAFIEAAQPSPSVPDLGRGA